MNPADRPISRGGAERSESAQNKLALIVDDDEDSRTLIRHCLHVGGWKIEELDSGRKAIEHLEKAQRSGGLPRVVLMDVMMPEMDGEQTLREIRASPWGKKIPVIFLTGSVGPERDAGLLGAGALGILPKPFDPRSLSKTVHEMLDKYASPEMNEERSTGKNSGPLVDEDPRLQKLAALREKYRQRLPGLFSDLLKQTGLIDTGTEEQRNVAIQEAITIVHRMHGTAGTHQLHEVSSAAGALEEQLKRYESLEGEARQALWTEVQDWISKLQDVIHATSSGEA